MWKVEILLTFEPIDKIKFTQRTQNMDRKENFRSILWTNWCCDNQPSFHLKDRNAMSVSTCFASSLKTVGSKVTIRGIHRPLQQEHSRHVLHFWKSRRRERSQETPLWLPSGIWSQVCEIQGPDVVGMVDIPKDDLQWVKILLYSPLLFNVGRVCILLLVNSMWQRQLDVTPLIMLHGVEKEWDVSTLIRQRW